MLVRLSGHSGAGKSRLIAKLPHYKITCPRAILYTSRPARDGEVHGKDYYFLTRSAIAALPRLDFHVGPVRSMLQAVDLAQVEADLKASSLVMVEIDAGLWPGLLARLEERMQSTVPTVSVFMTAVDPERVRSFPDQQGKEQFVRAEVERILRWRKKDPEEKIPERADSAVRDVLPAVGPEGGQLYTKVFHSSPEGPDGQDEWTREAEPVGRARQVLEEFAEFYRSASR